MQGYSTHKREPVDITKVYFAAEEKEEAKEKEEENGAEEVGVIHDVLVNACKGVEDCECLSEVSLSRDIKT